MNKCIKVAYKIRRKTSQQNRFKKKNKAKFSFQFAQFILKFDEISIDIKISIEHCYSDAHQKVQYQQYFCYYIILILKTLKKYLELWNQ